MNKIAFIQPYFGKFPEYFRLHLQSIEKNPDINWIFFTDDQTDYSYPENTEVHYMTFSQMKKLIQSKFDFPICLNKPYKLCDYKVAYGYIFAEYLKDYDFWGHCDVDVIFGDLRKFLTEDILQNNDLIFRTGHFRLYRNISSMNLFFRNKKIQFGFREIFSHDENYAFDEMNSMQRELLKSGFRYYDNDNIEADTDPFQPGIQMREVSKKRKKYQVYRTIPNYNYQIFAWENGHLYRYFLKDEKLNKDEFCDIHLLKRKMNVLLSQEQKNNFLITPDAFLPLESIPSADEIIQYSSSKVIYENTTKMQRFKNLSRRSKYIKIRKKLYQLAIFLGVK